MMMAATERRWACKTIRGGSLSRSLPTEEEYAVAIEARQRFAAAAQGETASDSGAPTRADQQHQAHEQRVAA
jgi:hypothetical protein